MKKKRPKVNEALIGAFIRKLHKKLDKRTGDAQIIYSVEECSLAVVAALLSLRMDQEPDVLLADAHGLLNNARDFLAEYAPKLDSDYERERATYISLNLKESMRALGYNSKSARGFWGAVDRAFNAEQVAQLRAKKMFDISALAAIDRCRTAGKSLRASKARQAKRRLREGVDPRQ